MLPLCPGCVRTVSAICVWFPLSFRGIDSECLLCTRTIEFYCLFLKLTFGAILVFVPKVRRTWFRHHNAPRKVLPMHGLRSDVIRQRCNVGAALFVCIREIHVHGPQASCIATEGSPIVGG